MKVVVEYSKEQNAFHRSTVEEREVNEKHLKQEGGQSLYVVIGVFPDYETADKFIEDNYDLVKNNRMYRDEKGNLCAI